MADTFIRRMLGRQRSRALAIILNHAERTFYDRLNEDEREEFRRIVLRVVESYHAACMDMVEASVETGMEVNQEAVQAIAGLSENIQRYRDDLAGLDAS